MFVENEKEWQAYRGMSPDFVKRVREKRKQQAREDEARIREDARSRRIEMLKDEATRARREVLASKAEKAKVAERLMSERVADQQRAIAAASTDFQWILAIAMLTFNVTKTEIRGASRSRHVVFARQFIMYWARRRTAMTFPQIGRLLGGRDHTTILHGVNKYVEKRAGMGRSMRVLQ